MHHLFRSCDHHAVRKLCGVPALHIAKQCQHYFLHDDNSEAQCRHRSVRNNQDIVQKNTTIENTANKYTTVNWTTEREGRECKITDVISACQFFLNLYQPMDAKLGKCSLLDFQWLARVDEEPDMRWGHGGECRERDTYMTLYVCIRCYCVLSSLQIESRCSGHKYHLHSGHVGNLDVATCLLFLLERYKRRNTLEHMAM